MIRSTGEFYVMTYPADSVQTCKVDGIDKEEEILRRDRITRLYGLSHKETSQIFSLFSRVITSLEGNSERLTSPFELKKDDEMLWDLCLESQIVEFFYDDKGWKKNFIYCLEGLMLQDDYNFHTDKIIKEINRTKIRNLFRTFRNQRKKQKRNDVEEKKNFVDYCMADIYRQSNNLNSASMYPLIKKAHDIAMLMNQAIINEPLRIENILCNLIRFNGPCNVFHMIDQSGLDFGKILLLPLVCYLRDIFVYNENTELFKNLLDVLENELMQISSFYRIVRSAYQTRKTEEDMYISNVQILGNLGERLPPELIFEVADCSIKEESFVFITNFLHRSIESLCAFSKKHKNPIVLQWTERLYTRLTQIHSSLFEDMSN